MNIRKTALSGFESIPKGVIMERLEGAACVAIVNQVILIYHLSITRTVKKMSENIFFDNCQLALRSALNFLTPICIPLRTRASTGIVGTPRPTAVSASCKPTPWTTARSTRRPIGMWRCASWRRQSGSA